MESDPSAATLTPELQGRTPKGDRSQLGTSAPSCCLKMLKGELGWGWAVKSNKELQQCGRQVETG